MQLGYHLSIQGGLFALLKRIDETNSSTFQIFSRSPRGGAARQFDPDEVTEFKSQLANRTIEEYAVHIPYVFNPASPKTELYEKAVIAIKEDLERADFLGAKYLVLHPGAHTGGGEEKSVRRLSGLINRLLNWDSGRVIILIENMAGAGTELGASIEQLAKIYNLIDNQSRIGVCLDTCHLFAAGYNLSTEEGVYYLVNLIKSELGIDKIKLIHLNDSKKELGSRRDLHENIGEGKIGLTGFKAILNHSELKRLPFIMETPELGEKNMATVKSLVENQE